MIVLDPLNQRKALFFFIFMAVGLNSALGQIPFARQDSLLKPSDPMFEVGEELEYKVSYSFFNIGKIVFRVLDKAERDGRTVYRAQTLIDSNPSLSWLVDLHIRFYGGMDEEGFSYNWIGDDSTKKQVDFRRMNFDYGQSRMFFEKGKKLPSGERRTESIDTIVIHGRCQDGMSLFFYARMNVRQKKQEQVRTFIENKEVMTFINFMNDRSSMEIDAVEYPVEVNHFDGRADFVGVFGLTGGFQGWFSNDGARIPIVARMKVFLGSVKAELVRWTRQGWQPPKFVE